MLRFHIRLRRCIRHLRPFSLPPAPRIRAGRARLNRGRGTVRNNFLGRGPWRLLRDGTRGRRRAPVLPVPHVPAVFRRGVHVVRIGRVAPAVAGGLGGRRRRRRIVRLGLPRGVDRPPLRARAAIDLTKILDSRGRAPGWVRRGDAWRRCERRIREKFSRLRARAKNRNVRPGALRGGPVLQRRRLFCCPADYARSPERFEYFIRTRRRIRLQYQLERQTGHPRIRGGPLSTRNQLVH
mmetsp:Transcript_4814/g.10179  ORF Transcript_4814/g.10179 Transcript_4814/m.10179 type:complete len:238 (+) Transcript_4814:268-981(+)